MKEIKFYNTLTRKEEKFVPIKKGQVGIYSCGPTVYWFQHIGNLRTYIFADILRKILEYNGYNVKQIINVTDVGHLTSDADEGEDKIEKAAKKEGRSAQEIANFYFKIFREDMKKLNILEPDRWTKASEHIKEQIELIKRLEDKNYIYKTSDGIYFDSSKFKSYGDLAKLDLKNLQAGKRISLGEKKNKSDFALWKFSNPEEKRLQEWDSPWGVGFPGWHIECSAMSMKYLGEHFDIHTGGEDHIPVHHTNEIAQSEGASGKKFVNYWMHGAFLMFNNEKVSKSKGGLYTISELEERGFHALHYRYLCLLTSYRKPLNFSLDALEAAKNSYEKIKRKIIELKKEKHKGKDLTEFYSEKFLEAINDDLNMPNALKIFIETVDDFNFEPKLKIKLLEKFDSVLGLGVSEMQEDSFEIPSEIEELVEEREKFRKSGNFVEADIVRARIREKGFDVVDSSEGTKIVRA